MEEKKWTQVRNSVNGLQQSKVDFERSREYMRQVMQESGNENMTFMIQEVSTRENDVLDL